MIDRKICKELLTNKRHNEETGKDEIQKNKGRNEIRWNLPLRCSETQVTIKITLTTKHLRIKINLRFIIVSIENS